LNQLGEYDDAIPYLLHAIEIDPGRPPLRELESSRGFPAALLKIA
jgi:hypothetical protein